MDFTKPCHLSTLDERLAYTLAIQERDDNADSNQSSSTTLGVANHTKFWKNGRTLRIAISLWNEEMFQTVVAAINQWAPHVNLNFEFIELVDNDQLYEGDIRILLSPHMNRNGSSTLGTDALGVLPHHPTMQLGIDYKNPSFTYITLHEFGHALGLDHEHQHPDAMLDWNLPAIYRKYENFGWTKEVIYLNILKKLNRDQLRSTPYDQKSIMHYSFSADVMWDKIAIPANTEISEKDIEFISSIYPQLKILKFG